MANTYVRYPSVSGGGVATYANFAAFPATAPDGTLALALDTDVLYAYNLMSATWKVIGGPGAALSIGSPPNGLSITSNVLSLALASTSATGALSNTDWNTFNNKQPAGNYLTALTGDGTASGPGSSALTLATVNANVGSFGSASSSIAFTVNAKGLVTAASATAIQIAESQVTNLVSDLAGKQPLLTIGNLTDTGTDGLVITGGTGAVIGSGASIAQHVADTTHNGYLSSTDWNTFNGKQSALTIGNLTDTGTDGITVTGGSGAVIGNVSLAQHVADATHNGYLSSTDWNTFNGKGSGTVTAVSVASANGFAGSSSGGVTPALTLSTTITGLLKGNATAISAATAGTDYSAGTSALATGILKSTTSTGALTVAVAADFPTLNQNTSGSAASLSANLVPTSGGTGIATYATGDILYASATNVLSKLAAGSNGNVLTLASGIPSWASATVPAIGVTSIQVSTYAINATDGLVLVDGTSAFTATLPTTPAKGTLIRVQRVDQTLANVVTIARGGTNTIHYAGASSTSLTLATQNEIFEMVFDGTSVWYVTAHSYPEGWQTYTSTLGTGWGTVSNQWFQWRRVGGSLEGWVYFKMGTAGTGIGSIGLPPGLTIFQDASVVAQTAVVGYGFGATSSGTPAATDKPHVMADTGTTTTAVIVGTSGANSGIVNSNVSSMFNNSEGIGVRFTVPIVGWIA